MTVRLHDGLLVGGGIFTPKPDFLFVRWAGKLQDTE